MKVCSDCLRCYEDAISACLKENHRPLVEVRAGSCDINADYRLEFLIKVDEIGETYRAVKLATDEQFVINVIAGNLIADVEKFQSQVWRAAEIEHPHLTRIYESGTLADGSFYFVAESVGGQLLSERLSSSEKLLEISAVDIARQTAEALENLHAAGLIHRNINPENIILAADAERGLLVKVQNIDFTGIRQRFAVSGVSNSETVINNLKYFSPEQCDQKSAVDFSTDIYSLGIVLYEMLARRTPFEAATAAEIIEKQIAEAPAPVQISNYDIRALITHTLTLSLQKAVHARLKSANLFARQLRHIEQYASRSFSPAVSERILVNEKIKVQSGAVQPVASPEIFSPKETLLAHIVREKIPAINSAEETNTVAENSNLAETTAFESLSESKIVSNAIEIPEEVINVFSEVDLAEKSNVEKIETPENSFAEPENHLISEAESAPSIPLPKPVLVTWNQPEDIPTEAEAAKIFKKDFHRKPNFAAPNLEQPKQETVAENSETEIQPAFVDETFNENFAEDNSFGDSDFRKLLSVPNNKLFIGGGISLLLVVLIGALWNWHSSSTAGKQTAASSPAISKPKPADEPKNAGAPAEKTDETVAGKDDTASVEIPDLPDSRTYNVEQNQPSGEKSFSAVVRSDSQNSAAKEAVNLKINSKKETPGLKNKSAEKNAVTQNAFPDIKIIIPSQKSVSDSPKSNVNNRSTKQNIFERPRIVDKKGNLRVF